MKFFLLFALIFQSSAWAVEKRAKLSPPRRAPASDPNAAIEVRGQSRNLNMMLILQNENELIDFIKLRKEYQSESKRMNY